LAVGAALALAIAGAASSAWAAERLFTLSGEPVGDISWRLDSSPTPDLAAPLWSEFSSVSLDVAGSKTSGSITVFSAADGGGLNVGLPGALIVTQGPEVFSGSLGSPQFAPGKFALQDFYTGASDTLTIATVPEPSSWASLLAGAFCLGGALRRARSRPKAVRVSSPSR
jgi:hypothetical protein